MFLKCKLGGTGLKKDLMQGKEANMPEIKIGSAFLEKKIIIFRD